MGVILDTSVLIALERGSLSIDALVQGREQESFGISAVTAAELLYGGKNTVTGYAVPSAETGTTRGAGTA